MSLTIDQGRVIQLTIPGEAEGRQFTIETLTADMLEVDPHVQRRLNESRVAKLAANFHESALGVFTVSQRQSLDLEHAGNTTGQKIRYVVLDGQTRLDAIRKFANDPETRMPVICQVYHGLTRAEEAEIFIEHNDRAAVRRIDLFRLALVAGHAWAVDLDAVVKRHGYEASDSIPKDRRFTAISTAERIIRLTGGMHDLDRAFDLVFRTWGHRDGAASAEAVDAFGLLFHRHGAAVDVVTFAKKLAATDTPRTFKANVLAYRAATGVSRTEAAYLYALRVYNSGRKSEARKLQAQS